MKLKICGLRDSKNILEVSKLEPEFMGFIFYEQSKRFVGEGFEMPLLKPGQFTVGVFVNSTYQYISEKIKQYSLSIVQLHGNEGPDFCKKINEHTPVIKAFGINEKFDFSILDAYKNCCEYFLFDTKTTEFGGSGKQFDWELLNQYKLNIPIFLSGGIGLEEIEKLKNWKIGKLNIFGVDVNSQFEVEPGFKDIDKLKKIFCLG